MKPRKSWRGPSLGLCQSSYYLRGSDERINLHHNLKSSLFNALIVSDETEEAVIPRPRAARPRDPATAASAHHRRASGVADESSSSDDDSADDSDEQTGNATLRFSIENA